jgi:hypothetical protein
MIQIGRILVSVDILNEKFKCDVTKCKGACCVHGDSGAPLEEKEIDILQEILPKVKPYLREEGLRAINDQGVFIIDQENEYVTPLIDNKECAYAIYKNGIAKCAIELAFTDKKIDFQKPLSCCLYPLRIKRYNNFDSVKYDRWKICEPARELGNELNIPVFVFVKDALIQKYGKEWYSQLKKIAKKLSNK